MADLYGTTNARSTSLESEEMSSFLHNLLHNSLTSPTPPSDKHNQSSPSPPPPPPPPEAAATASLVGRLPIFSDPGRGFMADARDCARNTFSAFCGGESDGITSTFTRKSPLESYFDEFVSDCKDPVPSRSSKRTRAAEVHNLSEKRRRSKINEKMKALQKLIPNSNKTDKASMLDEAIEYLKQLQLQVQMLSMRNGLSLHPLCLPGSVHPTQLPPSVISFNEGNEAMNTNRGEGTFSTEATFDLPNHCALSSQPNLIFPMTNIDSSETSFGLEPSIQNHYGHFSHLTPLKELCREDRLSQLQLDMSCSGKNSSSGVSS